MENSFEGKMGRLKRRLISFLMILLLVLLLVSVLSEKVYAEVEVVGTKEQRDKIARWLSLSLGTTVTIGADGKISVGAGGNKGATRLRNMVNDATTSVKIKIVQNDPRVTFGAWQTSADGRTTNGTQLIDIGDLEGIGNVINCYGVTPDTMLIHEITEVYEGKKGNLSYADAHKKALEAEEELMKEFGHSFFNGNGNGWFEGGYWYLKIKRKDGSFVVIRVKLGEGKLDVEWFKEKTPCNTTDGTIPIPDPDPRVQIFDYDFGLSHSIIATWDEVNSHPTGVALDDYSNLYVSENLVIPEIRIFDSAGNLISTIITPELSSPKGIAVDRITGDIFVAAGDRVIRYNSSRVYLGWYDVPDPAFDPTDVAVWRNLGRDIYGTGDVYDIYVTDRASNQVYRFNVNTDMSHVGYTEAFGSAYLVAPEGLAVDSWQQIWVASTGNNRIYRFLLNGDLAPFGAQDFFVEDVSREFYDVEMLYPDGVYAVDETMGHGALLLYDYNGILIKTYGEGTLQCPESIAIHFNINEQNLEPFEPPPFVSISPLSASIWVGKPLTFTPIVDGGTPPYKGTWFITGMPPIEVPPEENFTFTPSAPGIYYMYLKVTDANNNTAQSETAKITVTIVPVGGYSLPIEGHVTIKLPTTYLALIAVLTIGFTAIRRKIRRKTK